MLAPKIWVPASSSKMAKQRSTDRFDFTATKMTSNNAILSLQANLDRQTLKVVEKAKSWAESELEPLVPAHWERASFPPNILDSFRRHCPELLGYTLPTEYGGRG